MHSKEDNKEASKIKQRRYIKTGHSCVGIEESNPKASAVLGWVSLATGVASMIGGMAAAKRARSFRKSFDATEMFDEIPLNIGNTELKLFKTGESNNKLYILGHSRLIRKNTTLRSNEGALHYPMQYFETNNNVNFYYYTESEHKFKYNVIGMLQGKVLEPNIVEGPVAGTIRNQTIAYFTPHVHGEPSDLINSVQKALNKRESNNIFTPYDILVASSKNSKTTLRDVYKYLTYITQVAMQVFTLYPKWETK